METKHIQSQVYFCLKMTTTLNTIHETAGPEVDVVYAEALNLQLEKTGPMEFIYFDCSNDRDKSFKLYIALPVKEMLPLNGNKYSYHEANSFDCTTDIHSGNIFQIGETYDELFKELYKNGIQPTNQVREVYSHFVEMDSPENITEIQVGIHTS